MKDLNKDNLSWVSELKSKIANLKVANQSVYLVISSIPIDGIYNFSQALSSQEFSKVRYFIIKTNFAIWIFVIVIKLLF